MIVNGNISIDTEKKTITIKLENGSYCIDHFPNGVKSFLEVELECLEYQKEVEQLHNEITVRVGKVIKR